MLEIRDASLEVNGHCLVSGIDFELSPGRVVAVIGANGAGKSSMLRLLSGEMQPTRGAVRIDGEASAAVSRATLSRKIAVLPQHSMLDFPFRAAEVVEMGRIPHLTDAATNKEIVAQVIHRLRLDDLRERVYTTLSGGERQRVQIARVLCQLWDCMDGGYFLFDEPTAPLDLAYQLAFLDIARDLAGHNAGVLLVMHDINLATRFADVIVIMRAGGIVAAGVPADVVNAASMRAAFDVDVTILETVDGRPLIYTRAAL